MKRICTTLTGLGLIALVLGGCASRAVETGLSKTRYELPAAPANDGQPMMAYLGAGDQLGNVMFVRYLASIRAERNERYATGTLDAPESD